MKAWMALLVAVFSLLWSEPLRAECFLTTSNQGLDGRCATEAIERSSFENATAENFRSHRRNIALLIKVGEFDDTRLRSDSEPKVDYQIRNSFEHVLSSARSSRQFDHIYYITDDYVSGRNIREAFRVIGAELGELDSILVYMITHGEVIQGEFDRASNEVDRRVVGLATRFSNVATKTGFVSMPEIYAAFDTYLSQVNHAAFFFDVCTSGLRGYSEPLTMSSAAGIPANVLGKGHHFITAGTNAENSYGDGRMLVFSRLLGNALAGVAFVASAEANAANNGLSRSDSNLAQSLEDGVLTASEINRYMELGIPERLRTHYPGQNLTQNPQLYSVRKDQMSEGEFFLILDENRLQIQEPGWIQWIGDFARKPFALGAEVERQIPDLGLAALPYAGLSGGVFGNITSPQTIEQIWFYLEDRGFSSRTISEQENGGIGIHRYLTPQFVDGPTLRGGQQLSDRPSVLFYHPSNRLIAEQLASDLQAEFNIEFEVRRGAGNGVKNFATDLIVHVSEG